MASRLKHKRLKHRSTTARVLAKRRYRQRVVPNKKRVARNAGTGGRYD